MLDLLGPSMPGNFAVRLRCPVCELESWITLLDRPESAEEIRKQAWEFKCRYDDRQLGTPTEVIEMAPPEVDYPSGSSPGQEATAVVIPSVSKAPSDYIARASERMPLRVPVTIYGFTQKSGAFHEDTETLTVNASGALVMLKTQLKLGDWVFLMHKSTRMEQEMRVAHLDPYSERETKVGLAFKQPIPEFWRTTRKQARTPKTLRVIVQGTDSEGHRFKQSAYTVDLSRDGARLDGIGFLTLPGQTIVVHRLWRKKKFRVVWIGQVGTEESDQAGILGLEPGDIWRVRLEEGGRKRSKNTKALPCPVMIASCFPRAIALSMCRTALSVCTINQGGMGSFPWACKVP